MHKREEKLSAQRIATVVLVQDGRGKFVSNARGTARSTCKLLHVAKPQAHNGPGYLAIKIPDAEPEDLNSDFGRRLELAFQREGLTLINAAVQRGCIEVHMEFEGRHSNTAASENDSLNLLEATDSMLLAGWCAPREGEAMSTSAFSSCDLASGLLIDPPEPRRSPYILSTHPPQRLQQSILNSFTASPSSSARTSSRTRSTFQHAAPFTADAALLQRQLHLPPQVQMPLSAFSHAVDTRLLANRNVLVQAPGFVGTLSNGQVHASDLNILKVPVIYGLDPWVIPAGTAPMTITIEAFNFNPEALTVCAMKQGAIVPCTLSQYGADRDVNALDSDSSCVERRRPRTLWVGAASCAARCSVRRLCLRLV